MTARAFKAITAVHEGSRATLTLQNPARKNAISPLMANELLHALADASADDAVRCVVLTGVGDAFCSGGDFGQMISGGGSDDLPHKGDYADLLLAMTSLGKPIIARVNGVAMGGGLGLVAASHFAVSIDTARFGTPEILVGLFPMMIMAVLARLVPKRRLLQMMLLGQKFGAEEAKSVGLVGSIVPTANLDAAIDELVGQITDKSPSTVRLGLEAYAKQSDMDLATALPYLRGQLGACLATEDAREGLTAFIEKRKPVWTGK